MPALLLSSLWGPRRDPVTGEPGEHHNGIDVPLAHGTPVQAVADGVVRKVTALDDPYNGGSVRVKHAGGWQTSYVHLSAVAVQPGQAVRAGDVLGLSGGTPGLPGAGKSTGPHLHFVVWRPSPDGSSIEDVDPLGALDWTGWEVYLRTRKEPLEVVRLR